MRPAATVMTKIALAGIGLPVILVLLCYLSLSSGGADHNRAAVHLAVSYTHLTLPTKLEV